jgi:N-acetylglutamate synthase-like GNAT family acetyltransferase
MQKDIIVRDAKESDSTAISQLIEELSYSVSTSFISEYIRMISGKNESKVIVAETGSEVIGLLSLHIIPLIHREKSMCRITALVVNEKYRGLGVGRKLVSFCEEYAKKERLRQGGGYKQRIQGRCSQVL